MIILADENKRVKMMASGIEAGTGSSLIRISENFNNSVFTEIESAIRKQASIFLPVISVRQIEFDSSNPDNNVLGIKIVYDLPDVGITDLLEFTI